MSLVVQDVEPSRRSAWMKKKPVAILSIVVVSIALGYLFYLSWLLGFLVCKYMSGKSVGERGKVRSIVIPLRRWKLHLHHWLCAVFILLFSGMTSIHLLTPIITYGFLSGFVFQGIYCYSDWHRIVVSRRKTAPSAAEKPKIIEIGQRESAVSKDNAAYEKRLVIGILKETVTLDCASSDINPEMRN